MTNSPSKWLFPALTGLGFCSAGMSAPAFGTDLAAAEAAVRRADSAWVAAASTRNVDAWLASYAADAIVLLPHEQLTSGQDLVRASVRRLLSRPQVVIEWRPIKVDVDSKGDIAYVLAAYELRSEAPGVVARERGKVLEIWRAQSDGTWRCIVDTWNPDEPSDGHAQSAVAQDASSVTAAPASRAPMASPTPDAAGPVEPVRSSASEPTPPQLRKIYGNKPVHYEEAIRQYFQDRLKDPDSVQFREITKPEPGYNTGVGGILMSEKREYGWKVIATINAQNSQGNYVGFKSYTFLFRGDKMISALAPLSDGEIN